MPDERAVGSWAYRAWGYGQPCLIEGCETKDRRPGSVRVIEQAHVRTGGMGRKADWTSTVYMCWRHHDESHRGVKAFEKKYWDRLRVFVLFEAIHVGSLSEAAVVTQYAYELWERGLAY